MLRAKRWKMRNKVSERGERSRGVFSPARARCAPNALRPAIHRRRAEQTEKRKIRGRATHRVVLRTWRCRQVADARARHARWPEQINRLWSAGLCRGKSDRGEQKLSTRSNGGFGTSGGSRWTRSACMAQNTPRPPWRCTGSQSSRQAARAESTSRRSTLSSICTEAGGAR